MSESTADVLRRLFPRTLPAPPDAWFKELGRVLDERYQVERRAICVDCGEPARPLPVEPTICVPCTARRIERGAIPGLFDRIREKDNGE
jgi:hypothetical protein